MKRFEGNKINHKRFGEGIIIEVEEKAPVYNSSFKVKFNNAEKKFNIACSKFIEGSDEFNKFVKEAEELKLNVKSIETEKFINRNNKVEKVYINYVDDEEKMETTSFNCWKQCKELVEKGTREWHGSYPVVRDNSVLYINGTAALYDVGHENFRKDSGFIYRCCDRKISSFAGHKWRYASVDEVEKVINLFSNENLVLKGAYLNC